MILTVKPTATADVKKYLVSSDWKVMEHALTSETIGTNVCPVVWSQLVFVKVDVMSALVFSFIAGLGISRQTLYNKIKRYGL